MPSPAGARAIDHQLSYATVPVLPPAAIDSARLFLAVLLIGTKRRIE